MARQSTLPPGYSYVPGTNNNRVYTPAGEEISRRQARNVSASERGYSNIDREIKAKRETIASQLGVTPQQLKDLRRTEDYRKLSQAWKEHNPKADVKRLDSEFNRRFVEFVKSKDNTPTGNRAQFLVDAGLREPDWGWDVGETDEYAGGGI
jgi:hypothetical protein